MNFTLVSTVFNEAKRLEQTISDLQLQSLQPSEIIITDAGSNDSTYDILLDWQSKSRVPIIVLQKKGCNVAEGRNMAIRVAQYDIIASTDFGCRFHPEWLKSIISPFEDPNVDVVGGSYTVIEADQDTIAAKAAYLVYNGYNTNVNAKDFIPSSRSIGYKKSVFEKVGGYCEWLTLAGDDFVFGKELVANGYNIQKVDKQYVYWGRHKKVKAFYKEAYRYGLGEGEANLNFKVFTKQLASLGLQLIFVVCLLFFLFAGFKNNSMLIYIIFLASAIGFKTYFNVIKNWFRYKSDIYDWKVLMMAFYLTVQIKLGYIKGYLKGRYQSNSMQKQEALLLKKRLFS